MRYLKKYESILKPYNIEERLEKIKSEISEKLEEEIINGDLIIDHKLYLDLESNIKFIKGDIILDIEKIPNWLESVEVDGNCWFKMAKIKSLVGSPKVVSKYFDCSINDLTSLVGAPEYVGEHFSCSINKLVSLEGAPKFVGGNFYCYANPVKFTEEDIRRVTDVRGKIYV